LLRRRRRVRMLRQRRWRRLLCVHWLLHGRRVRRVRRRVRRRVWRRLRRRRRCVSALRRREIGLLGRRINGVRSRHRGTQGGPSLSNGLTNLTVSYYTGAVALCNMRPDRRSRQGSRPSAPSCCADPGGQFGERCSPPNDGAVARRWLAPFRVWKHGCRLEGCNKCLCQKHSSPRYGNGQTWPGTRSCLRPCLATGLDTTGAVLCKSAHPRTVGRGGRTLPARVCGCDP
jgi:hypothetical protein